MPSLGGPDPEIFDVEALKESVRWRRCYVSYRDERTGSLVAELAHGRGSRYACWVRGEPQRFGVECPVSSWVHMVIDLRRPRRNPNLGACLANGARVVVGTTAGLTDSTICVVFQAEQSEDYSMARTSRWDASVPASDESCGSRFPHYQYSITETHHADKKGCSIRNGLVDRQFL